MTAQWLAGTIQETSPMAEKHMQSLRIIYCTKGERGRVCLQALQGIKANIVAIILSAGESVPNPGENTPVLQPNNINDPDILNRIREFNPDLIILAGFTQIVRSELIRIPTHGVINMHGGKLPEYRGGSPINWQIINGEPEGGCVIHYVDEGIDTGDIIFQEHYPIGPDDSAEMVISKTLEIFPKLLVKAIGQILDGKVNRIKQDPGKASYFKKRYPEDGRIFWNKQTAKAIHNTIRALHAPTLPGAFCFSNGHKIILCRSILISETINILPGQIVFLPNQGVAIGAKDSAIKILEVRKDNNSPLVSPREFFVHGQTLD